MEKIKEIDLKESIDTVNTELLNQKRLKIETYIKDVIDRSARYRAQSERNKVLAEEQDKILSEISAGNWGVIPDDILTPCQLVPIGSLTYLGSNGSIQW